MVWFRSAGRACLYRRAGRVCAAGRVVVSVMVAVRHWRGEGVVDVAVHQGKGQTVLRDRAMQRRVVDVVHVCAARRRQAMAIAPSHRCCRAQG